MCNLASKSGDEDDSVICVKTSSTSNVNLFYAIYEFVAYAGNLSNNIDEKLVLFILGACSGGMFGEIISYASMSAGMSMIMKHYNIHESNRSVLNLIFYSCLLLAYIFNCFSVSIFGACELGYSIQKLIQHGELCGECLALVFISLNLIVYDTYLNLLLILGHSIFQAIYKILRMK